MPSWCLVFSYYGKTPECNILLFSGCYWNGDNCKDRLVLNLLSTHNLSNFSRIFISLSENLSENPNSLTQKKDISKYNLSEAWSGLWEWISHLDSPMRCLPTAIKRCSEGKVSLYFQLRCVNMREILKIKVRSSISKSGSNFLSPCIPCSLNKMWGNTADPQTGLEGL